MAFTLVNGLSLTVLPVYNPMRAILLSNQISQPNFRYRYDFIFNGQTITIRQSPRPDGYSMFDMHRIFESYVGSDFDKDTAGFALNSHSWVKGTIKISEEYSATPADTVAQHSLSQFSLYAINVALENSIEALAFNVNDYYVNSSTGKFLTNAPRTQYIGRTQKAFLHFLNYPSNVNGKVSGYTMKIKTYLNGVNIDSDSVTTPYDTISDPNGFQRVSVGADYVNSLIGLPGAGGYYTIQLFNNNNVASSELFTFYLDDTCTKYTTYRLHFLNKLGGFDAYNFRLKDTLNTDIVRTTYERMPGTFSAGDFNIKQTDRGVVTTDLKYTDRITVNSDWLTNAEFVWLKELFTSPEIYWEDEIGNFRPVTLTAKSYETKKSNRAAKQNSLTLEFTLRQQNRQRF